MKTVLIYLCLIVMIYGNCYLFSSEVPPVYYNHYLNILPIALFFIVYGKQYSYSFDRKWVILTAVSFLLMTVVWQRDSGSSSLTLLCYMLIPQFCNKVLPRYKIVSVLVFLVLAFEAVLCIYEYIMQNNLFYRFEEYGRFRSSGIWGHPLHNASIVSVIMLLLLVSPIRSLYKILSIVIGFVVLFTFNGRAAIISTLICLLLMVVLNTKKVFTFLKHQNIVFILGICIAAVYLFGYISTSDLGGKLFSQDTRNFNDGSAMTRFYLYNYVFNMDVKEWLFGVGNFESLFKVSDFLYVESTPVSLMLSRGLVIALPLILFQYSDMYKSFSCISKMNRYVLILDIIIIGLSSESFIGIAPWVMIYLTYSALFTNRKYITNENRNINFSSFP